jgi:peptide/nickel transport system substrate-binding protein
MLLARFDGAHDQAQESRVGRWWSLVTLGAIASLICLAGTAGAQVGSSQFSAAKPVLHIGAPYSPYAFYANTAKVTSSGISLATEYGIAYDALFHLNSNGETSPELATSGHYFNTSRGPNKGFTFTLRHGVRFSDGTPLTAAVVVAWFNWFYAQKGANSLDLGLNPTFTAKGQWTVVMDLTTPTPNLPVILSDDGDYWGLIGSLACQQNLALWATQTCGTGAYMLDISQTVKGDTYTYVPNPYYWNKKNQKFGGVVMKVIPVASTALAALEAGQLDLVTVASDSSTVAAAKAAGLSVQAATIGGWQIQFSYSGPNKYVHDIRVRQAIAYALDRKGLAQLIGAGGYSQATDLYPQTDVTLPKSFDSYYTYDPAKAKSLLAAAGASGMTLTVVYNTRTQDSTMVEGIAKYLDAVGINTVVVPQTPGASLIPQNSAFLGGRAANTTPVQYGTWFNGASTRNILAFGDPVMDHLYYAGLRAPSPIPSWTKMWERELEQANTVNICTEAEIWYFSNRLSFSSKVTAARLGTVLVSELSPKQ